MTANDKEAGGVLDQLTQFGGSVILAKVGQLKEGKTNHGDEEEGLGARQNLGSVTVLGSRGSFPGGFEDVVRDKKINLVEWIETGSSKISRF